MTTQVSSVARATSASGAAPKGATATVFRTETRLFLPEAGATFWILVFRRPCW